MTSWRAFLVTIHLTCLGIWLGMLGGVVATAATAFPALKTPELAIRVGTLPPDAPDQYRFAAGAVAAPVFLIGDTVAFGCAMLSVVSMAILIISGEWAVKRIETLFRSLAMGVALASLISIMAMVTPAITDAGAKHFQAAKAGDAVAAAKHKQAVDELHPTASRLYFAQGVSVFILLVGGAWAVARRGSSDAPSPTTSRLPQPAMLKAKRR